MIHKDTLTKEWITKLRDEPGLMKSDTALIEKMIFALYLLECLAKQSDEFIFKGGTSLLLILNESYRFSVDIDIVTGISREEIENILDKVISDSEFVSYKLDEKRSYGNTKIPKAHYFIYYKSNFNNTANYILLDILFQQNVYPEIKKVSINTPWLKSVDPDITVAVPAINDILGDKLTAFAPNTSGVPFKSNKEIEIIKQLFDVSLLIEKADNYEKVFNAFNKVVSQEIAMRGININANNVLNDIVDTASMIAKREKNNEAELEKFNEIKVGLSKITSFIIGSNFRIDEAIEASAKAAWFAMKLKVRDYSGMVMYNKDLDTGAMQIDRTGYTYLNKLKRSNKAAFYYWYKCIELIKD